MSWSREEMKDALAKAGVIMERGLDALPLSPLARSLAAGHINWLREMKVPSVRRKESEKFFDHGPTKQIEIEQAGEVDSYLDGSARKISTASICRRLIALAILSHPFNAPERKARLPEQRYRKGVRARTGAELEGLREGNRKRAEAAQRRREEAKVADRV